MSGQVDIIPQHQLSAVTGVSQEVARARLLKVVWAAPRDDGGNVVGAPGLHDLRGTQRTMIVNDLTKHGIRCCIRVVSAEALREVCTGAGLPYDAANPLLTVKGPTDASYVAGDIPWVNYEIGTEWREYPAIFASWLDYARGEDRRLGASYVAMRRIEDLAPGGEKVVRWQEYNVRAIDLFEFRMPGDDAGSAPIIVPGQDTRTSAEFAQLHAMIAQLQHQMAGMAGVTLPPREKVPYTYRIDNVDLSTPAQTIVPGERVRDEAPGVDDKFEMAGGAFITVDRDRQAGYNPAETYDPATDGGSDAELAAVVNATGGGSVKARRAQR